MPSLLSYSKGEAQLITQLHPIISLILQDKNSEKFNFVFFATLTHYLVSIYVYFPYMRIKIKFNDIITGIYNNIWFLGHDYMVKKFFIRSFTPSVFTPSVFTPSVAVLLIVFIIPASAALTLVEEAQLDQLFGERIAYLAHHPAVTQKDPNPSHIDTGNEQTVGRNFVSSLPKNLSQMEVEARKNYFISSLLPLILRVNELITEDREMVISLQGKTTLTQNQEQWLLQTAGSYKLDSDNVADINFAELLIRMDQIPPSLALAQAAIESGWGTSRFAQQANALYGQWTWSDNDSAGLAPTAREEGETHRIKSFAYLIQSVRAYALNLNSHHAYADFRTHRASGRDGNWLTSTLIAYSTRREAYVKDLQSIIRTNNLSDLDQIRLVPSL